MDTSRPAVFTKSNEVLDKVSKLIPDLRLIKRLGHLRLHLVCLTPWCCTLSTPAPTPGTPLPDPEPPHMRTPHRSLVSP